MRHRLTLLLPTLSLSLVIGCAAPPDTEVASARAAVDAANTDDARRYAPAALKSAQDARAALDEELRAQEAAWFKSYDRANTLAASAKTEAERVAVVAAEARSKADADAARVKAAAARAATATATAAKAKAATTAVRVGGRIRPPVKIKDVTPVYPVIAKTARVRGMVTLDLTIGPDGKVSDAKVVRSVPLLDQAALDAVRQWQYRPTLMNGVAVPVITTVNINFTP